ncbi:ABC transporter permease [Thermofilum pendens]|uniref:Binding-protein-dependent transport systems inner membrane component n=1 Tax=Thermofilum pendens (strain DSM 2475 / Hrk 5) TaxID=368408 RepID=A1S0Q2_THEPD|nr:ABC transporter permease [Thermofilum pendens]ABL79032.1 binding-protein-dependent transport systems inner membrane component [Thermofilum pendens Hrk 5]
MGLKEYVLYRVLLTPVMLFVLLSFVFILMRVLPGDPITMLEGKNIPEEVLARRRAELGLDKPLYVQYFDYLYSLFVKRDLGETALERIPVAYLVASRLPATIELTVAATLIAAALGIALGLLSARYQYTGVQYFARFYSSVVYSVPVFYLGLLLQAYLAKPLGFPTTGRLSPVNMVAVDSLPVRTGFVFIDSLAAGRLDILLDYLAHISLPALTLGVYLSGVFSRVTYLSVEDAMSQDYTQAARGRGIREWTVVKRYGLRNALIPILTMTGLQVAALLGGAVLTETTFNWEGVGLLVYEGILKRDYAIVQGAVTIYAVLVTLTSLVVDVLYAYVDPRVRYE